MRRPPGRWLLYRISEEVEVVAHRSAAFQGKMGLIPGIFTKMPRRLRNLLILLTLKPPRPAQRKIRHFRLGKTHPPEK
jgi:hypothetical protein